MPCPAEIYVTHLPSLPSLPIASTQLATGPVPAGLLVLLLLFQELLGFREGSLSFASLLAVSHGVCGILLCR